MSDTPTPSELAEQMAGTEAENEPGSSDDDEQPDDDQLEDDES